MDGNPSIRGPSESATHIARADCPHLSDSEWEALQRLATVIVEASVATNATNVVADSATWCCSGVHCEGAARFFFCCCYYGGVRCRRRAVVETAREQLCGKSGGGLFSDGLSRPTLPLWFDASSTIRRRLRSSCLDGRARSWAYGHRLTDDTCFGTYAAFKEELRQAFEPPKNEFRSRAEFLDLQQGKHDVHAYAHVRGTWFRTSLPAR
ncbi:hypothetical protein PC120_g20622 [Phytophthora cactorum]|nr:hypothetical protein PC120_g20622 [Phytophthora cactorum]